MTEMHLKFVNARSPLRQLEKALHGGLGVGNLGVLVAGHGLGKTAFLVGVALDELLRGGSVLHVALGQSVSHVRDHYDALFEELAASLHIEDPVTLHAEIDRQYSIRSYQPRDFSVTKLDQAVEQEREMGHKLSLVVIEGVDLGETEHQELAQLRELARDLGAEVWLSVASAEERVMESPAVVKRFDDLLSVVLALEPPEAGRDTLSLRALRGHDDADLTELRVALDPRTLLLVRS
jgi:archaellum biogenesis ATPase FlaH